MAYTPNEQITTDEDLVMFRDKCPFCTFIKSKPVNYGVKVWVAGVAKNFYAYNMQVYNGKTGGTREKKQDLREFTKVWSVTCMELEEVLPLIISSQVVK